MISGYNDVWMMRTGFVDDEEGEDYHFCGVDCWGRDLG
jgi:hypothetical protein